MEEVGGDGEDIRNSRKSFSLNVGRLSIGNLITFGIQILAAVLALVFAVMNYLFYKADEIQLHKFFGENVPQGVFASSQDGFLAFCMIFAVLGIVSIAILLAMFATRGEGKKNLYYGNMILLAVMCICGIYCLFGFHLVPAELGAGWDLIISSAEALGLDIFKGVEYPWPEEFIAIFSGLAFVLLLRKKARKYIISGDEE